MLACYMQIGSKLSMEYAPMINMPVCVICLINSASWSDPLKWFTKIGPCLFSEMLMSLVNPSVIKIWFKDAHSWFIFKAAYSSDVPFGNTDGCRNLYPRSSKVTREFAKICARGEIISSVARRRNRN